MGDSVIIEMYGVGGFVMVVVLVIVLLVGGIVVEVLNYLKEMLEIIMKENFNVMIFVLDFMGIFLGIDVLKVLEIGMLFVINIVIVYKELGIGMIGVGLINLLVNVFNEVLKVLIVIIN